MKTTWFFGHGGQINRWLLAGLTLSLIVLLTACPGNQSVTGTLVVTIQGLPAGLEAAATVSGPGGFSETLTASGTLENLSPGSYTVSASAVSQGADSYSATVSGSPATVTPGGTATVSVSYALNNPNPDPDPAPDPDASTISGVSLQGYGASTQVRQGVDVIVEVTGTNLSGITFAKLGDIDGVVQANNPISAAVTFSIPHATELGPKTLSLTADLGVATFDDAVTITATTAGPAGNDATGKGTPDSPFRSLNKAVSVVEAGDSILLLDGAYSEDSGEVWPVTLEDLVLMGESQAETIIQGPAGSTGLLLRGTVSLAQVTVTNFNRGIDATRGTDVTLTNVSANGNLQRGFSANFLNNTLETVTVQDATFNQNGGEGFLATSSAAGASYTISNSEFSSNGSRGLYILQSSDVTVTGSTLSANVTGIELIQSARLTFVQSTVTTSNLDGILATGSGDLTLNDVVISGSLRRGVDRGGTGKLTVRNSQIINNVEDSVRVRNSPVVNLGDQHESGNNVIGNVGAGILIGDYLADDRPANSVPKILAHGVTLGNQAVSGSHIGPGASNTPLWRISNAGNEIDFGP